MIELAINVIMGISAITFLSIITAALIASLKDY